MQFNAAPWLKKTIGWSRDYDLHDDLSGLYDDLEPVELLTGRVRCMRIHSGVLVTGNCRTVLNVACSRCLEPIRFPVEFELEETFRPLKDVESGGFLHPDAYQGQPETMFDEALIINDHYVLDLTEVVRQHLWIAAVQNPVCAYEDPADCPHFQDSRQALARANGEEPDETAAAPAVDPRWAALLPLLPAAEDKPDAAAPSDSLP